MKENMLEKLKAKAALRGVDYQVLQENEGTIREILDYFFGTPTSLDPRKGILLMGGKGCGKTTLFRLIQLLVPKPGIHLHECRHILREFQKTGMDILDHYGRFAGNENELCLDDLGLEETNSKLYGNQTAVIEEILQDRYVLMEERGLRTHAITNLDSEALKNIYSPRTVDRFRDMFNKVTIRGTSFRGRVEKLPAPKKEEEGPPQPPPGYPTTPEGLLERMLPAMKEALENPGPLSDLQFVGPNFSRIWPHICGKLGEKLDIVRAKAAEEWIKKVFDLTGQQAFENETLPDFANRVKRSEERRVGKE